MKEILFRGKRVDNGEWVISKSIFQCINGLIQLTIGKSQNVYVDIDPSTVGQFTGLLDKNGKRIFEGDIISSNSNSKFIIKWNKSNANFVCGYVNKSEDYFRDYYCNLSDKYIKQNFNVIGNIHDNEELLEVEE